MAQLHSFTLPEPFNRAEILQIENFEQRENRNVRVCKLYLVDPFEPLGLRLLKTSCSVVTTVGFPQGAADDAKVSA